jgi:hypothetical protein
MRAVAVRVFMEIRATWFRGAPSIKTGLPSRSAVPFKTLIEAEKACEIVLEYLKRNS